MSSSKKKRVQSDTRDERKPTKKVVGKMNEERKGKNEEKKEKREKNVEKKEVKKLTKRGFEPIIYSLPTSSNKMITLEMSPTFSSNYAMPRLSLGFHHYIHENKKKMEITNHLTTKKKFYYVVLPFETQTGNDANTGLNASVVSFLQPVVRILSRGFFKLWEMMLTFDLVSLHIDNFVSAHLAEGPGSFAQATMLYRDKYADKSTKNDKFYAITLYGESKEHIPAIEKTFIDYYTNEKPVRFLQHVVYPMKEVEQSGGKLDNGDLTDPNTIVHFGGNFTDKKANFVTADGGINWKDENIQEQEASILIFAQICTAINIQAKGGNFVIKFFETFTNLSIKFICLLRDCYEQVHLVKPLTSRESNSEKYAVCVNFQLKEKEAKTLYKKMLLVLKEWHQRKSTTYINQLTDIFEGYIPDKSTFSTVTAMNIQVANQQILAINKIIDYIQKNNYFGDEYHQSVNEQKIATNYWISTYFRDNVKDAQKYLSTQMSNVLLDADRNIREVEKHYLDE